MATSVVEQSDGNFWILARYAAPNANFGLVFYPHNGLAARSAAGETAEPAKGRCGDIKGQSFLGWFSLPAAVEARAHTAAGRVIASFPQLEVSRMRNLVLLTSLSVVLVGSGALAHHPFDAEFDRAKPITLTGTVESLEWANPHASMHVKGSDMRRRGATEGEWTVELGSPDELTKAGWSRETFKSGDKVTIQGWRARDGSMKVNARAIRTATGKNLMASSSFDERDGGQLASRDPQGADSVGTSGQLPGTATVLPLTGLVGLLSLGAAIGLYVMRR
jgi:hypothetical protein